MEYTPEEREYMRAYGIGTREERYANYKAMSKEVRQVRRRGIEDSLHERYKYAAYFSLSKHFLTWQPKFLREDLEVLLQIEEEEGR